MNMLVWGRFSLGLNVSPKQLLKKQQEHFLQGLAMLRVWSCGVYIQIHDH